MKKFLSRVLTQLALIGAFLGLPVAARAQTPAWKENRLSLAFNVGIGGDDFLYGWGVEYRLNETFHAALKVDKAFLEGRKLVHMGIGTETPGTSFLGAGANIGLATEWAKLRLPAVYVEPYARIFKRDGFNTKIQSSYSLLMTDNIPVIGGLQLRGSTNRLSKLVPKF